MGLSCSKAPQQKECLVGGVTHKSVYESLFPVKEKKSIYIRGGFFMQQSTLIFKVLTKGQTPHTPCKMQQSSFTSDKTSRYMV